MRLKIHPTAIVAILFLSASLRALDQTAEQPPIPRSRAWLKPVLLGSFAAGTLALASQDRNIQEDVPNFRRSSFARRWRVDNFGKNGSFFEAMGGPVGVLGVGGAFYSAGLIAGSPKAEKTALLTTESYLVNGVFVLTIKELVGRSRPVNAGANDPDDYRPFSGQASFPSGHTSVAFAMATVVCDQYPSWWVGGLSYGTAGLVGVGRVLQNQHWTTDVLAGAALGIASGKLVLWWNRHSRWGLNLAPSGKRLALTRRF